MGPKAVIIGSGRAVPRRILDNHELSTFVETSDEWIVQRTGIKQRHICGPDETAASLSIEASQKALANAGIGADELDLVICATVTGDMPFPATACFIQEGIGAKRAGAFDVGAACAGFIYGLAVAHGQIAAGLAKRILVVGVDVLSKYVDWSDRSTCVLFGDGAAAVIVEAQTGTDRGVENTVLLSDGSGAKFIDYEVGGSRYPIGTPQAEGHRRSLFMAGAEVYRFAVGAMGDACCRVLENVGLTPDDIDLFVPHQANIRIIESAANRLGLPSEKVYINVQRYGNTSGGSIPIALDEASEAGILKPGMRVMTVGFGAGLVWGANLIRW